MSKKELLQLTIARVDGPVFDGEVKGVAVPGKLGAMKILPHHAALISPLKKGEIVVETKEGEKKTFSIEYGTLEISDNHAMILI